MDTNISFCEQCGNQLNQQSKFCTSCGWKVPRAETNAAVDPVDFMQQPPTNFSNNAVAQTNVYQPVTPVKSNNKIVIAVIAVVIVVLGFFYFKSTGSSIKPEQLTGIWSGTVTLTRFTSDSPNDQDQLNKALQSSLDLNMDAKGMGSATFSINSSPEDSKNITYSDEKIKMVFLEDGQNITFKGDVKETSTEFTISGTFNGVGEENKSQIIEGKWEMSMDKKKK